MKNTGKHTLIIDGNYFLFRTLYVIPRRSKTKAILDTEEDIQSFMSKLATDFSYQVRLFDGLIDKIVWTVDSKSWRKDFYPEADYKGNRKQGNDINWENFSKVADDLLSILAKRGVIVSKIDGAEADDLIYAWNTESLANNKSVIMLSGDRDMIQLVNKATNGSYSILFSPANSKLYTYQGFSEWMESDEESEYTDIFDIMKVSVSTENQTKKLFQALVKKKKVSLIETDPEEFKFVKILIGDNGDNVPPAYWYALNDRRYGISEAKAVKIVEQFKLKYGGLSSMYLYNNECITDLANITIKTMNAKHMSRERIISNIRSNINLMILSSSTIPEGILEDMFRSIESKLNVNNINLKEISSMKQLLEGTRYKANEGGISISSKIFNDNETEDFSFIKDRKQQKTVF
jgi:5'-3' exonuclease